VAFESAASNLVLGDTNARSDVFVRDRDTGTTRLVSSDSATGSSEGGFGPAISGDGRWIAFTGWSSQGSRQVFLHDVQTGTTSVLTPTTTTGEAPDGPSAAPQLNVDGSVIAFHSDANNLVSGDAGGSDVFVHDRSAGTTTLVTRDDAGFSAFAAHDWRLAGDGQSLLLSGTGHVLSGEPADRPHLYLADLAGGALRAVDVNAVGVSSNSSSELGDVSADGSRVVFGSAGHNLVEGDTNGQRDVFLRDMSVPVSSPGALAATLDGAGGTFSTGREGHCERAGPDQYHRSCRTDRAAHRDANQPHEHSPGGLQLLQQPACAGRTHRDSGDTVQRHVHRRRHGSGRPRSIRRRGVSQRDSTHRLHQSQRCRPRPVHRQPRLRC
jgi:hypothetical protein